MNDDLKEGDFVTAELVDGINHGPRQGFIKYFNDDGTMEIQGAYVEYHCYIEGAVVVIRQPNKEG